MSVQVDMRELEAFATKLEQLSRQEEIDRFCESCAKELAARLLRKVVKYTPVGVYKGDIYVTKGGKRRYRKYKTVKFTTAKGEQVEFQAKKFKVGGTLHRGWTALTEEEAKNGGKPDIENFMKKMRVDKVGSDYQITISNPVSYAPYVEYGHRTRNHKGWVEGKFMLTLSEAELNRSKERIITKKLEDFLRKVLDD